MKKKLLSILIATAVCLSLTGCSALLNKALSGLSVSSDASESEKSSENQSISKVFTRGTWSGDTYTSDFFDVQITLPEGWARATDEEIANTFGTVLSEMSSDTDYSKVYMIYDMAIANVSSGINLVFMMENMTMYLGGTSITEDGYLQITASKLEQQGFTIGDTSDAELGGYPCKKLTAVYSDGTCQEYYFRRVGDYMAGVVGSYLPEYADDYNVALNSISKR